MVVSGTEKNFVVLRTLDDFSIGFDMLFMVLLGFFLGFFKVGRLSRPLGHFGTGFLCFCFPGSRFAVSNVLAGVLHGCTDVRTPQ